MSPQLSARIAALGLLLALVLTGWSLLTRPAVSLAAMPQPLPVFVLAGQSNMVGFNTSVNDLTPPELLTQTQVLFYGPNELGSTWGALVPPTTSQNGFGPEISLGQTLVSQNVYTEVAEVKYAVGNTNLAMDWNPALPGSRYARLLARVAAGVASLQAADPDRQISIAGFFWMQGESDANDSAMAAAYAGNLAGLIAAVRTDLSSPDLPVIVGRIRAGYFPYADTVRQAEAQVAISTPNVRLVDTDALPLDSDGVHYSSGGIVTLGTALADSYGHWLAYPYQAYLPFMALSSTR